MDSKIELLIGFIEPTETRIPTWQKRQSESGFKPIHYWIKLNQGWSEWRQVLITELVRIKLSLIKEEGEEDYVEDVLVQLYFETRGQFTGHLSLKQLESLWYDLYEYGASINENVLYFSFPFPSIDTTISPYVFLKEAKEKNIEKFKETLIACAPSLIIEYLEKEVQCFRLKLKKADLPNGLVDLWLDLVAVLSAGILSNEQLSFVNAFIEKTKSSSQKVINTIQQDTIGFFCRLLNYSNIIPKKSEEVETDEMYCKKICELMGFKYSDRVRQVFSTGGMDKKRLLNKVEDQIISARTNSELVNKLKPFIQNNRNNITK